MYVKYREQRLGLLKDFFVVIKEVFGGDSCLIQLISDSSAM